MTLMKNRRSHFAKLKPRGKNSGGSPSPSERRHDRAEDAGIFNPRDESRVGRAPADGGEVIFGVEPVRELLAVTPAAVRTLYIRAGAERRFNHEAGMVRTNGGRVISADDDTLRRMAGSEGRHQGLLALIREYRYTALEDVLGAMPDPLVLVDGVTDPRNLGALLRSAEGAGVRAVILARDHTVGLTPAAIKASAGAWAHLTIARCGNVVRTLEQLKDAGYWIAALAPEGEVSLYELDAARKLVLLAGAEGSGVRELVKKRSDFLVRIPMRGQMNSLNVAVATAVALFELARRRADRPR
ncbi:MAG: 23S rRNA (guanosine(2251)-2'-O)-methyltransferase RlmB [Candidatus Binataceae bacterium]